MQYLIYADGYCHGNGKEFCEIGGSMAVFELADGEAVDHEIMLTETPMHHIDKREFMAPEGTRPTNNIAEALSLHMALSFACERSLPRPGNMVLLYMDSELVLKQFTGIYRTRNIHLKNIYRGIYTMLENYSKKLGENAERYIKVDWVSGEVMKQGVIGH